MKPDTTRSPTCSGFHLLQVRKRTRAVSDRPAEDFADKGWGTAKRQLS